MIRFLLSSMIFACLTGCLAGSLTSQDTAAAASAPPTVPVGQYHFGWKLSGNRAVAPLQIFDDGHRTWLQFLPGQPAPAIFARLPQGDQLLTPAAGQGGLFMLDGVWPQLILRGGSLQSVALRLTPGAEIPTTETLPVDTSRPAARRAPRRSTRPRTQSQPDATPQAATKP